MNRTNSNHFRANLKEWFEAARTEPIRITRKTGESFVLLSSDEFEKIQIELAGLRGLVRGLSDVIHGRVRPAKPESIEAAVDRAKARFLGKKTKKAVG